MNTISIKKRYEELEGKRKSFLERAKECAKYTIPMLLTAYDDSQKHNKIETPFQGIGARGLNNLASKLLITLMPPNSSFFRLNLEVPAKSEQEQVLKSDIELSLADYERRILKEMEANGDRVALFEALKHLLISGNVLLHIAENKIRVLTLGSFVIERDALSNVLEMITHEKISLKVLQEQQKLSNKVISEILAQAQSDDKQNISTEIDLYTQIVRSENKWIVRQQINDIPLKDGEGEYPIDSCPFIPVRFHQNTGSDYGRSFVEEYLGDLKALDTLQKAIIEGSAASAKVLFLVDPNGMTTPQTIAQSKNGAVKRGNARDVTVLQTQKMGDFHVTQQSIDRIEQRLAFSFLLNTSIQRRGERVTAEEIKYMASELEDALGGVYSVLTQELQYPYVKIRMFHLMRNQIIPYLPNDSVQPAIITGIEALGRGHDRFRLMNFLTTLAQTLGPQALTQIIHTDEVIKRLAICDGVDPKGLVKSQEELQQEQSQNQQMNILEKLGPEVLKQMKGGNNVSDK